jgi:hypothetical protein
VAGLTARWRVLSEALPSSITRLKNVPMVKSRSALLQGRWCSRYLQESRPAGGSLGGFRIQWLSVYIFQCSRL